VGVTFCRLEDFLLEAPSLFINTSKGSEHWGAPLRVFPEKRGGKGLLEAVAGGSLYCWDRCDHRKKRPRLDTGVGGGRR